MMQRIEFETGLSTTKYIGYCKVLPIKRGDTVTIEKGVKYTYKGEVRVAQKTQRVIVDHMLCGSTPSLGDINYAIRHGRTAQVINPQAVWAGSGGYWKEIDINLLPEVYNG